MDSKRRLLVMSLVCAILFSVAPVFATTVADNASGNSTNDNSTNKNSTYEENIITDLTVDFNANVTSGKAPLNVLFTSNCTGNPTGFNWTFGDGTYSTHNLTAIHTYTQPGKYNVSLTVSNSTYNETAMKIGYINVSKGVSLYGRVLCSGKAPLRVMYLDRSKNHISTYWDFGDGTTSTSRNILHIYKKPGKYPLKLTVISKGHYKKTLYPGYVIVK
jgi:PKD repeat protein